MQPLTRKRAILTKYLGPTDTRGSRILARFADNGKRFTMPYGDENNALDNHWLAACALASAQGYNLQKNPMQYAENDQGYIFFI